MGPMKDQRCEHRERQDGEQIPLFVFAATCRNAAMSATSRRMQCLHEKLVDSRLGSRTAHLYLPPSLLPSPLSFLPLIMAFAPRAIILSGADMTAPPQTNDRRKEGREKVREPKRKGPSLARLVLSLSLLLSFPRSILPTLAAFCLKFHAILKAD